MSRGKQQWLVNVRQDGGVQHGTAVESGQLTSNKPPQILNKTPK